MRLNGFEIRFGIRLVSLSQNRDTSNIRFQDFEEFVNSFPQIPIQLKHVHYDLSNEPYINNPQSNQHTIPNP